MFAVNRYINIDRKDRWKTQSETLLVIVQKHDTLLIGLIIIIKKFY